MNSRSKTRKEWWRRAGRVSLEEAARGYRYFRIVPPQDSEYCEYETDASLGKPRVVEEPRVPRNPMSGEDATIPRVPLAKSIWGALAGTIGSPQGAAIKNDHREVQNAGGRAHEWHVYGARPGSSRVVTNVSRYVPDAHLTGEVWSLSPIELHHIGIIGGDYGPDDRYVVWVVPSRKTSRRRTK